MKQVSTVDDYCVSREEWLAKDPKNYIDTYFGAYTYGE